MGADTPSTFPATESRLSDREDSLIGPGQVADLVLVDAARRTRTSGAGRHVLGDDPADKVGTPGTTP